MHMKALLLYMQKKYALTGQIRPNILTDKRNTTIALFVRLSCAVILFGILGGYLFLHIWENMS